MHIEAPNLRENHPDRDLQCQDCIEGIVQEIIAEATRQGWESGRDGAGHARSTYEIASRLCRRS